MGQEMEGKFDKSFYSIQLKPTQHNLMYTINEIHTPVYIMHLFWAYPISGWIFSFNPVWCQTQEWEAAKTGGR